MKTKLEKIKKRAGVTLIELLIGLTIFSVFSVGVTGIMSNTFTQYAEAIEYGELNDLLDVLSKDMISEINRATQLTLQDNELKISSEWANVTFGVTKDGYLYRNKENSLVLSQSYYKKKTIKIDYFKENGIDKLEEKNYGSNSNLSFCFRISIMKDGEERVGRTYAVTPIGLNQYKS